LSLFSVDKYKELLKAKYEKANNPRSEARYLHSLSVGRKAVEIVQRFNFDCDLKKIEIAGILHDYAKFEPLERYEEIVKRYNLDPSILNENYKILHSLLGDYIVREELGIEDKQILNAIKYHTTGSLEMDRFAEVIYVADLAEDLRTKEGLKRMQELAKINFYEAMLEKIKFSLEKVPNDLNRALYEKYKKYVTEV